MSTSETNSRKSPTLSLLPVIAAWMVTCALLLSIAWWGMSRVEHRLLEQDAEDTALAYADYLAHSVPDLDRLFSRKSLTIPARRSLLMARELGNVFRFRFFDPQGRLLLVSDDITLIRESTSEMAMNPDELGNDRNQYVRDIVLGGSNYVVLEDGREKPDRPDLYSEAYVPLIQGDQPRGVIEVYVDQTDRQNRIASAFANIAIIITGLFLCIAAGLAWQIWLRQKDRRRGDERMRYLAKHDVLSGALNRRSFEEVLEATARAASQNDQSFAIHCVDLDRFKEVNDTLGHAMGDKVLQEVATRLTALHQPGDVLARLGGDEFAILQANNTQPRDVEAYGNRIVEALAKPLEIEGSLIPCASSVGAACYGRDGTTISDLLHKADLAMYRSKMSGRGRFSFYDEALDQELEDRRLLAIDLRTALAEESLSLHYQPLFETSECESPVGQEALMRWNHPTRGNVPPSIFIPLAEECGVIEALGTWAIQQACHDAASWDSDMRVAVNLSPAQFRPGAADVVTIVSEALSNSGLAASRLELEITESLLISDSDEILELLNRLSALGVKIAMDDFGTGYSSLSYLWRFPFDKVKIDRSFIKELEEGKVSLIVSSIISLAHSMGMRVNAEGVETESQREALRALGCDELQGFLLGRPAALQDEPSDVKRRAA